MGAGCGNGPDREAGPEGQQGECEPHLRHEHAADEFGVRYGDVAQRRL